MKRLVESEGEGLVAHLGEKVTWSVRLAAVESWGAAKC